MVKLCCCSTLYLPACREGYDRNGLHKDGYDRAGLDKYGYDKAGYNKDGYDRWAGPLSVDVISSCCICIMRVAPQQYGTYMAAVGVSHCEGIRASGTPRMSAVCDLCSHTFFRCRLGVAASSTP
jgi:hypothetical protein